MKKPIFLFLSFLFLWPSFVQATDTFEKKARLFMKNYQQKNAAGITQTILPPRKFFMQRVKEDAFKSGKSVEQVLKELKTYLQVQEELINDCLFKFFPITEFKLLETMPDLVPQRVLFLHVLEEEERFIYQARLDCRKLLFQGQTLHQKPLYVYMEVCRLGGMNGLWVDRVAVHAVPGDPSGYLSCAASKLGKLAELADISGNQN